MSMVLRDMMVVVRASTNKFVTGMNQVAKNITATERALRGLDVVGKRLQNLGRSLTIGLTLPLVAAGIASVKLAADAEETENLFRISMGKMAEAAEDWTERLSVALGLNKYELQKNLGMMNQMLLSMGLGRDASYDMATGLVQLAHDMASFYNLKPEEAFDKLRSGIAGQSRPLRDLGILVDDTAIKTYAYTHGIAEQGAQLTNTQKVMARYGVIMEATKNAQGDLERTSDSLTNQVRRLGQGAKELGAEFGKVMAPTVNRLVHWLNDMVTTFKGLTEGQKRLIIVIGGVVAAIGPMLLLIGTGIRMIKSMAATVVLLKTGFAGLIVLVGNLKLAFGLWHAGAGTLMASLTACVSPVTLIMLGIVALIAVGYLLVKNWDTVKRVALNVWGHIKAAVSSAISSMVDAYAWFISFFDKQKGAELRAKAEEWRAISRGEREIIEERNQLATEAAEAKRQAKEAEELANAQGNAGMLGSDEGYYDDSTDLAEDTKDEKVEYLDEFETAFDRAQDDMLTKLERTQEDATTKFKNDQEDQLTEFKRTLEAQKTTYKRNREDLLRIEKDRLKAEMDALEQQQRQARDLLSGQYDARTAALRAQQDVIRAEEEAEEQAKRHAEAAERVTEAEEALITARALGDPEEIAEAEERLAETREAQREMLLRDERRAAIDALQIQIDQIEAERDVQMKGMEAQQEQERNNLEILHDQQLTQYERDLEDAEAQQEALWDAREEGFKRGQEQAETNWKREQENAKTRYQRELEDLKDSLRDKLDAQRAYLADRNSMLSAMESRATMTPGAAASQDVADYIRAGDTQKALDILTGMFSMPLSGALETIKQIQANFSNIPKLAGGATITGPTLAVLGERGREYVLNESQYQAVSGPVSVRVFIGNRELHDLWVESATDAARRGRA